MTGAGSVKLIDAATLENRHVRLEPFAESHREALRAAGNDGNLWAFASLNQYNADFDSWFDAALSEMAKGERVAFTVLAQPSDAIAGSTSYLNIVPAQKRLEIGWTWYAKPFWAGAVNPSCKLLLMQHAFETLKLIRVELKCDARNARSRDAIARLGAKEEGTLRHHMILPDGHLRDTVYFSVLAEEWPGVKHGLEQRLKRIAATRP